MNREMEKPVKKKITACSAPPIHVNAININVNILLQVWLYLASLQKRIMVLPWILDKKNAFNLIFFEITLKDCVYILISYVNAKYP